MFGLVDAADEPDLSIDVLLRRAELAAGETKRHKVKRPGPTVSMPETYNYP